MLETISAGELCMGILESEFHRPLINGKANRENIEDAITIGMMEKKLGYVSQETVDIAIALVNDLLALHNVKE
jgi:hypothetical protein